MKLRRLLFSLATAGMLYGTDVVAEEPSKVEEVYGHLARKTVSQGYGYVGNLDVESEAFEKPRSLVYRVLSNDGKFPSIQIQDEEPFGSIDRVEVCDFSKGPLALEKPCEEVTLEYKKKLTKEIYSELIELSTGLFKGKSPENKTISEAYKKIVMEPLKK